MQHGGAAMTDAEPAAKARAKMPKRRPARAKGGGPAGGLWLTHAVADHAVADHAVAEAAGPQASVAFLFCTAKSKFRHVDPGRPASR
jgi:hypothetical protein